MSAATLHTVNLVREKVPVRRTVGPGLRSEAANALLAELGFHLFAPLPRSDQRCRGMNYLQGLLTADGRKSVRNIAAAVGGHANEQRLHHFVASSTWRWTPVRRALAEYVERAAPPSEAWVVRPMVIPKAGESSVGVTRQFLPYAGQVLNAQLAVGVWTVSESASFPVNWRLHLSDTWLDDAVRRSQASIPDAVASETLGGCAQEAYLGMARKWGIVDRPVVLDSRECDSAAVMSAFDAAGVSLLIRMGDAARLLVSDPALRGQEGEQSARQIMRAALGLRRPVVCRGSGPGKRRVAGHGLVATARVRLSGREGLPNRPGHLILLGVAEQGQPWPAELWLTNLVTTPPAELLRLTRLVHQVEHDFTRTAERVGIRDYAGRSFGGWHRHVTLASAAHAVAMLSREGVVLEARG